MKSEHQPAKRKDSAPAKKKQQQRQLLTLNEAEWQKQVMSKIPQSTKFSTMLSNPVNMTSAV